MAFKLEFYRNPAGVQPALEYIRGQPKGHRAKIGRALKYLEDMGHMARRPQVEYLGHDIHELRAAKEHLQHRLLYFFHGRSIIVVTSGLLKNQGRVPQEEIERARGYRADWLERFGGHA
ncbi:MAG: type II toxin-antitoxin system RelE/ParE family toxin [Elusimicrobia bacterium]|nr:type II toxin-antitoxin system RelE/ParE family toxin [Elusimicrobiota bacterium]